MTKVSLSLAFSPGGQVYVDRHPENNEFLDAQQADRIHALFEGDATTGLLFLGIQNVNSNLPASISFWQKFSHHFINKLYIASIAEQLDQDIKVPYPSIQELEDMMLDVPFMKGAEYLSIDTLVTLWKNLQISTQQIGRAHV